MLFGDGDSKTCLEFFSTKNHTNLGGKNTLNVFVSMQSPGSCYHATIQEMVVLNLDDDINHKKVVVCTAIGLKNGGWIWKGYIYIYSRVSMEGSD